MFHALRVKLSEGYPSRLHSFQECHNELITGKLDPLVVPRIRLKGLGPVHTNPFSNEKTKTELFCSGYGYRPHYNA